MNKLSADSPVFLNPIYAALSEGKNVLLTISRSRVGGVYDEYLLRKPSDLDLLRNAKHPTFPDNVSVPHMGKKIYWVEQAAVDYFVDPTIIWDGEVTLDTVKIFWEDNNLVQNVLCSPQGVLHLDVVESLFDWLADHKGKLVTIVEETKWVGNGTRAYVPLANGEVKPGAY